MSYTVLDVTAGNRAMWFDKEEAGVVFLDKRPEVKPTVIANSMALPFQSGTFDIVVFDPPHTNLGRNSNMAKAYGYITGPEILVLLERAAKETSRVVRNGGSMIFKWNNHDRKLTSALAPMAQWWRPMCGQRVTTRRRRDGVTTGTYWAWLKRQEKQEFEAANLPATGS